MEKRTLEVLEYPRIRETIAGLCMSAEGKARLLEREPSTDLSEIRLLKSLSSSYLASLSAETPPALAGWPPVRHLLARVRVEGASLSIEELYALGLFCDAAVKLRAWAEFRSRQAASGKRDLMTVVSGGAGTAGDAGGAGHAGDGSSTAGIPSRIASALREADSALQTADGAVIASALAVPDLTPCADAIFRVIDRSGEIRDLPELRAIKQGILKIRQDIERLVGRYLSDEGLRGALQSTLPTIRDGRQVIAIRASVKSRVRGIVHEVSQSGQTVYVEPEDVVDRNNDLVTEEHRLSREVARILREVTASLAPSGDELAEALELMVFFDGIGAAARWGRQTRGVFAVNRPFSEGEDTPLVTIRQGRHPLLEERAVPIDLFLTPGGRVLIVTGPNTGGKTVTLKTVALFALLNQSGWPIPSGEGTALPVFDFIGCDIGDEQSLDQSLSTFSGHMKNIASMMGKAGRKSLILLDELGSGTDPQEGSAIAMAVLDALLERGAVVLATTHHGILKNYGYTHRACVNASVDFDENTLSPTYRILMGVPGESHALDIAARNGLDGKIVDQARSYLIEERADVSALIKGLTEKHEELDRFERDKKSEEEALRELRRKSDLRELQLRQKENELRGQGYRRLENLLAESRKQLENLVRELREGELTRDKTLQVKAWMADLEGRVNAEYSGLASSREETSALGREIEERAKSDEAERAREGRQSKGGKSASGKTKSGKDSGPADLRGARYGTQTAGFEFVPDFAPGVEVYVGASRSRGTLVRADKKGQWIVTVGTLKMTVKETDLSAVPVNGQKKRVTVEYQADMGEGDVPSFELRLIGMRHDEAMKALERQLDLASMKGLKEFSIVHGKGNGVLQTAAQDMLSRYAAVSEYHFARPEEGGTGKTIVIMK